jgi:hypothetical protein
MSKIAIMQPYLFPYIGYFQLMAHVDVFVVYDNLKYTKKGWINRNRILVNGKDEYLSMPIKNGSDFLSIKERYLAETASQDKKKVLNKIIGSYKKAPYFDQTFPLVQRCLNYSDENLFNFIHHSLNELKHHLGIDTKIVVSSEISIDHSLRSQEKVIAICKALRKDHYINPIGGAELYDKSVFEKQGIKLEFLKANNIEYPQFNKSFVPFLSIIDVLMFNSLSTIKNFLSMEYTLQ